MKKIIAAIIVLISLTAQSQATIYFPKRIKIEEIKTERIDSKAVDPVSIGIGLGISGAISVVSE